MKIVADYPGGNIIVKEIRENEVFLEQELRGTGRWWFYWNFKIIDPPVGNVKFNFLNGEVVCRYGPTTSIDGINWNWHTEGFIDHTSFEFNFTGEKERYFAFSLPYQLADFERFWEEVKDYPTMKRDVLTISEGGREIPILRFGKGKKNIIFACRHHCCESTGSIALQGTVQEILKNHPRLMENFKFHVIPFVDIDGVELGDQGKERPPHDHNRDYIDEPIYAYTKAIYKYVENMDTEFYLDYHSPGKWGWKDENPTFYSRVVENHKDTDKFIEILRDVTKDPKTASIAYTAEKLRGSSPTSSNGFFFDVKKARISLTVENPYSGDLENGYTFKDLHQWGENLAIAIEKILLN